MNKTMKVEGPLHVVCQCDKCKAQPEQEPVAWISENAGLYHGKPDESLNPLPLYLAPPKRPWVDLSDSQIEQVYYDVVKLHRGAAMPWGQVQFGKALQALIKEKNYG